MRSTESNSRSVLGRAFKVLDAFGPEDEQLTLAELERRSGIPKGTLHRMAGQLVDVGALDRVDASYRLGLRLFEFSKLVPIQRRLRDAALPFLHDLYEATREVVHLGLLDGTEVVYVERIAGHRPVRCPTRVGGRMPLYCTALGKAMLAFSQPNLLDSVMADGLRAFTPHTITVPTVFEEELARVREEGVAFDREEAIRGIVCVGAPILIHGEPIAALSVTGPGPRLKVQRLAGAVRTASLSLSRILSVRPFQPHDGVARLRSAQPNTLS